MPASNILEDISTEALQSVKACCNCSDLQNLKTKYLGHKSHIADILKSIKDLSIAQKIETGKKANIIKAKLEAAFVEKFEQLQQKACLEQVGELLDPTLPYYYQHLPKLHPLTNVRNSIIDIFKKLGYSAVDGNEIETEWFCFDALNVPINHPARNSEDTFYLKNTEVSTTTKHLQNNCKNFDKFNKTQINEKIDNNDECYLLRTQTSTMQIRTLIDNKPPLRIISPGRVFRRDTVDAKHNFNFHQAECLCVDKSASIVDLKGTLDFFIKKFFGKELKTRFRVSFFPFTEPSFEVDIYAENLGKINNTWIEVCGCGMVHPNVLKNVGLDPNDWQGFAIGFGIERFAMLLYGIDDIRLFYQNDERFLKQF